MKSNIIHPSTLRALSTCRLQHHWSRFYQKPVSSEPLEFGKAVHIALESYYKGGSAVEAFKHYAKDHLLQLEGYTSLYDLGLTMMQNYERQYKGDLRQYTTLATEIEATGAIPKPHDEDPNEAQQFEVSAIIDALVRDSRGNIWVMEHKTFSRFYAQLLTLDHQFVIETFVAQRWAEEHLAGSQVVGVIYNGLRKKVKAPPALFERHKLFVNDHQMTVALHRTYWQLKDLNSDRYRIYPEPSTVACNYCVFKEPCAEYNRGGDYRFLLDHTFVRRED